MLVLTGLEILEDWELLESGIEVFIMLGWEGILEGVGEWWEVGGGALAKFVECFF
jgi:hypothetical protein